ncbi:PREDICTED: exostosin-2 [Ceratosolen solmsi marchali]|uniref:Exostosin-2 n=1 Tax=Ceratosolen solmsi marchali TaxID=326594 RepID=A0AAJ6YR81_9HYME|nr:PREDICTED: exostosin-2 [Ceratosolen solmsi marchali]
MFHPYGGHVYVSHIIKVLKLIYLIVSTQININPHLDNELLEINHLFPNELLILQSCSHFNMTDTFFRCTNRRSFKYPEILQTATFCLVVRGEKLGLSVLLESLATCCIPVIIFDSLVMPFDEVIDWSRAAVFIREIDIQLSVEILKKYSLQRIKELQNHGSWLYNKYFQSIQLITETTLDIITDRIFPSSAKNYYFWNEPRILEIISPVFVPVTIPKNDGFTAVILTYDRIDLLFLLIHRLSKVPSLNKVLIVWNNEKKKPPQISKWPKIYKRIKIIQTKKNILSNRFYPFDEIETEAVLSIDDDIIMLTEDEIEFAFEVWREFPDRIVGFPSRTHTWDNKTACWKYESEWTNRISMVLTGAAFYHKYWNYIYTTKLPEVIKEWVDKHMNCEDIAMNFLISNITRKAPIKVSAKKKFRCPECVNTEMLSADLTHMVERTQCINQFIKIFGYMPLISVEFRADPVLFKDNFPDKLKRFNNIGSL